jgi:sodium/hydrogen antiporter
LRELYVSLAAVGGLLLLLGVVGGLLKERTPISEPLIALLAGVLIGPAALGLLDLAALGNETLILEEAVLLTLGIALVGVALRLPVGYASGNWRLLVVLLGILMPLMWIVSGLLVYLILGLPFWVAVLIGAIITPTDPVVASSIVAGGVAERNLPSSLRCAISAESGFNDGLALPFVVLPVLVLTEPPGEVLGHWLTHTVLLEIVGGAVVAAVLLLRRLPAVLALRPLLGPLRSKGKDVLFLGWFGPIGAAALYYAAFSYRETGIEAAWTVGSLVICASVLVHGITATPLTKLYGRLPQNV